MPVFINPHPRSLSRREREAKPFAIQLSRITATTFPSPFGRGARGEGGNCIMLPREKGRDEGKIRYVAL
jgi:hypothetical protein